MPVVSYLLVLRHSALYAEQESLRRKQTSTCDCMDHGLRAQNASRSSIYGWSFCGFPVKREHLVIQGVYWYDTPILVRDEFAHSKNISTNALFRVRLHASYAVCRKWQDNCVTQRILIWWLPVAAEGVCVLLLLTIIACSPCSYNLQLDIER